MTEIELNQADKKRITDEIKLTSILGLLFSVALIVLVLIIALILYFFGKPADGFVRRSLYIMCGLSLPFLVVSWTNMLRYIDLKKGVKRNFTTADYEIKKEKDGFVLRTRVPLKMKFDLYNKLPDLIRSEEPITIETTKLSKILLFISQDSENLLNKVEKEDN